MNRAHLQTYPHQWVILCHKVLQPPSSVSPYSLWLPFVHTSTTAFLIKSSKLCVSSPLGVYVPQEQVHVQSLSCVQLLQLHGLYPARLLCPCDFPGKNTGVDCHFLLLRIYLLNPGIEPESPALADGFFAAEPPGKPSRARAMSKSFQYPYT